VTGKDDKVTHAAPDYTGKCASMEACGAEAVQNLQL
jgi:hypothetical protein